MKIYDLRVNHIKNPLGHEIIAPVFSYRIEGAGSRQTRARIVVSEKEDCLDPVFDSGWKEDIDSIAYEGHFPLRPRRRYFWQVEAESDVGEKGKSEVSWFETAKMDEPWQAKWIGCEENGDRAPEFSYQFRIEKPVSSARLYVCGLGLYEAYLGGEKIGSEYFTPYSNNYDAWLQYQTYDVGTMLTAGENQFSVLLGNGWWKGRFGLNQDTKPDHLYGDKFLLIAELHVLYTDGTEEVIGTDERWQWRRGNILWNSFYDGEEIDGLSCEKIQGAVTLAAPPKGRLTARRSLPVLAMEELEPVRELTTPKNEFVLDMGQNHSGIFLLTVREKAGTKLKLLFGEELQDGNFFNGNLRTGKSEFYYTCDGTERTIRPHFTWFGYRYVKIEGLTQYKQGDYKGLVLYSELEETALMKTDNVLVNGLIHNALWGQKSNFLDVPMDCPQRDERMGWTGDAQVFCSTACYQMDCQAFYKKWLFDMYEEQKMRHGAVPFCVPACGQTSSCAVWGDACTIVPWAVYETYGDIAIIRDQYESMKAWVEYVKARNGDDWRWREVFHFGDWLALDSRNPAMPTGGTDTGFVASVYYYYSVRLTARAAALLGKTEDAKAYSALAAELKKEIVDEYFSPNGRACISTQTGLLMALYFDLAPDREVTKKALRKAFKANGDKLETGFVGTSMLNTVLTENGMADLAYSLLLYKGYPGWLYSVKHGATTIWERWDSLDEDGHFSKSGLNSLNHYSYGSIVGWMYRYVAGIKPKTAGFREAEISPVPDYRLGSAETELLTSVGVYRSAWRVTKAYGLAIDVTVPFGGTAYVYLPYAPQEVYAQKNAFTAHIRQTEKGIACVLAAGEYHIEYMATRPMRKVYDLDSTIGDLMADEKASAFLKKAIPMIGMLPESMYDKTFREVIALLPQAVPEETLKQLGNTLKKF